MDEDIAWGLFDFIVVMIGIIGTIEICLLMFLWEKYKENRVYDERKKK